MPEVKFTLPEKIKHLPLDQRFDILKSFAEQLGADVEGFVAGHPVHTSYNPDRNMWTPDEVPMIAALEDWFYGELSRSLTTLQAALFDELGLDAPSIMHIQKSFGDDFFDWLEKSNESRGFRLSDLIRMNRETRERLIRYVADGGVYTKDQLNRLRGLIEGRLPDYGPLLEAYAIRSVLLGKLKQVADTNNLQLLGTLISKLPVKISQVQKRIPEIVLTDNEGKRQVVQMYPLSDAEVEAIRYAEQHAAQYVTHATDRLKLGIQQVITDSRRNRRSPQEVQQTLLERFGEYNRDFRRIALTEITDSMAQGYIASLPEGARVMGQGASNACPHCKRLLIGQVYSVTKHPGDPMHNVWVGKTNVGNKVREYVPVIPLHPHCRCRWTLLSDFQDVNEQGVAFIKPLEQLIEEYKKQGLIHPDYDIDHGGPVSPMYGGTSE